MLIYKQRYKPRTTREFTKSDLTVYDSADNTALNALTVYGKSEVVDGAITSAGEGWSTVDLGTLDYIYNSIATYPRFVSTSTIPNIKSPLAEAEVATALCGKYHIIPEGDGYSGRDEGIAVTRAGALWIWDTNYTNPTAFKTAMSGVILAYQLADPTQGNTIAVKTDDGSGIDGTMATFTTGTPLRGISDSDIRDVMVWDGSAGTVTKNCNKVRLADLTTWSLLSDNQFYATLPADSQIPTPGGINALCSKYARTQSTDYPFNKEFIANNLWISQTQKLIIIRDTDYTTVSDFVASLGDAELVYELAAPTTTPLAVTENASIAGLRTFEPQTHAQNNAQTDMTVDYTIRVPTI